jgi:trans-aconitate 2-methyltransferase
MAREFVGVQRGQMLLMPPSLSEWLPRRRPRHVDAWQTEYVHVLQGEDPVLEWVRGTGLRPPRSPRSPRTTGTHFSAEYGALLRDAYPRRFYGTAFPFKRTFVVAHRRD